MRIWQKYVIVTVKSHENTRKPHLTKYLKLTTNYLHLLKDELFLYIYGVQHCIQDANKLTTPTP